MSGDKRRNIALARELLALKLGRRMDWEEFTFRADIHDKLQMRAWWHELDCILAQNYDMSAAPNPYMNPRLWSAGTPGEQPLVMPETEPAPWLGK